ncbi:uncharacterized protein LOC131028518 isoform X1 [Cryptomeria japonica]|uniref:uncharacterized protein LOC131028518 isoform X1 n=1 Tax=Cryptomeria japonica TaxID=3369 RepID=UPI0025ACDE1C|nr:uncharacterized protein LOC131028518 isoform X1 [Cryptomeria japonica]
MESYSMVKKSSIDEIFEQSSCAVCHPSEGMPQGYLTLGILESGSATQIKESLYRVHSAGYEKLGELKQPMQSQKHQIGSTLNCYKANEETEVLKHDKILSTQQCFLGSSLYYGGPDELYEIPENGQEKQNETKMAVKKLKETIDPFHLECSRRGNCWEGSLYY